MKQTPVSPLSERYQSALQMHWEQGPQMGLQAARELGREAVVKGLETLDLATLHDQALAALVRPDWTANKLDIMTSRAALFFKEAITPIEETHQAALNASASLHEVNVTLQQRTRELAESNLALQQGIAQRKSAKQSLKSSEAESTRLLKESQDLEQRLQEMTHQILESNEQERKKMSHQLQDEIAQTLVGINVRLLALTKEANDSQADLNEEIASTQRLVNVSVKTIKDLAREFDRSHES
jgi:signal transduction histidine kinase